MAAAAFYTITQTCRRNASNPEPYVADIIGRIADHPASRIDVLLPVEPAAINAASGGLTLAGIAHGPKDGPSPDA